MDDALAYAKEVYAACVTIGFAGESVISLKHLIEANEKMAVHQTSYAFELTQLAQRAHIEAASWAAQSSPTRR